MQQKIVKLPRWKDGTPKSQGNAFDWRNWESKALDNRFVKAHSKMMSSSTNGAKSNWINRK